MKLKNYQHETHPHTLFFQVWRFFKLYYFLFHDKTQNFSMTNLPEKPSNILKALQ